MVRGRSLATSRIVAVASVVALLVGGCTVVFPEEGPARIILTPRPVRTLVVVPAVAGQQYEQAEAVLAESRLDVGEVTYRKSIRPTGTVIAQEPNAGSIARMGTAVKLTLAVSHARATVPNVVGKGLVAAKIKLHLAGLRPGNVMYRSVPGVTSPRVGSQSYVAGSRVALGTSVDLVVNNPSSKISVPSVAGKKYVAARQVLQGAGLRVSGVSSRQHPTIQRGHVVSQSPFAGSLVDPGSGVKVVLSAGSGKVAVPYVTGKTPASAIGELARSGLRPTIEYRAMAGTPGRVASQSPSSGAMVDRGSTVKLIVRKALPSILRVTVPDVKGKLPGEAKTILTASGLSAGTMSQGPGRPGRVVSQTPNSGTSVARGTSVALVVGRLVSPPIARVSVPNVVGLQEAAAGAALHRAGLQVGNVTKAPGPIDGRILKQSRSAGSRVRRGTKVDLTVAERKIVMVRVSVPNVVGMQEAAVGAALRRAGLQVGTVTKGRGPVEGRVLKQSVSAGSRVARGSKVDLTVATRRITTVHVSVPNVVGMSEAAAGAALRRVGLQVGTVTKARGAKEGVVLSQSPAARRRATRGSKVDLTVSTRRVAAATVSVPSVIGMQEGAANAALRRVGLQVGTVTKAPGAVPGRVLKQSPSAGAKVLRGFRVAITVSEKATVAPPASKLVTVPNVVGMTLGQARSAIRKAGLEVGAVARKRVPGARRGRISAQTPAAGTKAAKGSKVDLVFAF